MTMFLDPFMDLLGPIYGPFRDPLLTISMSQPVLLKFRKVRFQGFEGFQVFDMVNHEFDMVNEGPWAERH